MNICFIIGKVVNDVDFKFIMNNKKYNSIAKFKLEIDKNDIINIKAYNEIADYCYKNLIKNDQIAIYGQLNSEMEVVLKEINIWATGGM